MNKKKYELKKQLLDTSWMKLLNAEFESEYFSKIESFLDKQLAENREIYPPQEDIFQALNKTPFEKVKVVIIGQDPYHGLGQAHGMSFSVKPGIKLPPSLRNIYKELRSDLKIEPPKDGLLLKWAEQGVLLINTVLTVEAKNAGSHHKIGWEKFTKRVIEFLNQERENLVFILWGAPAQKNELLIDETRHLILKAPHPSPLSSYRGFFGCKHFSKTNDYLLEKGFKEIDWSL